MNIDYPKKAHESGLRLLWQEAFGDSDGFLNSFFDAAFSPDRCRCVTEDGVVTAALYWFDCVCEGRKIAYLYAVATAKNRRGKGLCRALMADTHRLLREKAYAGAMLVPGEPSLFRFYEAMGYRACGPARQLTCAPGESAVDIKQIGTAEFARLRRDYLPEGGVIQEGENLRFLETMAAFYRGDNFLLAAVREGRQLVGLELLGDEAAAGGIVRAFGCEAGCFHTPGGTEHFALYYPLSEAPAPAYFGFPFA